MIYRRSLLVYVVLAVLLAACGGGNSGGNQSDDSSSNSGTAREAEDSSSSEEPADAEDTDTGVDLSSNGMVRFHIGGNVDETEGEWYYFPPGSSYIDGNWALNFLPNADGTGDAILYISLQGDSSYVSYTSTELMVGGDTNQGNCEFDVDHSDSDGAAGSFSCDDVIGFRTNGSTVDGITFEGTFDTRS